MVAYLDAMGERESMAKLGRACVGADGVVGSLCELIYPVHVSVEYVECTRPTKGMVFCLGGRCKHVFTHGPLGIATATIHRAF